MDTSTIPESDLAPVNMEKIDKMCEVKEEIKKNPEKEEQVENQDDSALLILKNDIYHFKNEIDAYEYAIRLAEEEREREQESNDGKKEEPKDESANHYDYDGQMEDEGFTCPFVVKMVDVDPTEYKKMLDSAEDK